MCIVLLPRQFHVTVVENNSENEIRRAAWLFPVYLVLINLFVVPIAAAGLMTLPSGSFDADMYVLGLPLAAGADVVTLLAFVGGLSAATAMVIVDSVALAIMVCNGLVVPLLLRGRFHEHQGPAGHGLAAARHPPRRHLCHRPARLSLLSPARPGAMALASIGLVSFAAIAQFAPAFFGGLVWRNATARGAIAGIVTGFAVWAYTLLLPWIIEAGWLPRSIMTDGPFGLGFLAPAVAVLPAPRAADARRALEHGRQHDDVRGGLAAAGRRSRSSACRPICSCSTTCRGRRWRPRFRMWRSSITAGELQRTVARYLGAERAERSFAEYAESSNTPLSPNAEADIHLLRFTEHLLASAIGAASSRLVLSLLLRRSDAGSHSALKLLDDASEALQYNRDLLQSALDQVRHGLSVFDKDMKLICWNRQFRELLNLPAELGRVGAPLDRILRTCAERGDFGPGDINKLVADRLMKLAVAHETFQEQFDGGTRILEIRTSPMPQGGIVTTYSDITERVEAAEALARANETLERRVRERTAELTEVNEALAVAKRKADEANLDKTRFLAAASHDVLQPLNAARLYATSLVERADARLRRPSLRATSMPRWRRWRRSSTSSSRFRASTPAGSSPTSPCSRLNDVFERLEVEFSPLAREKGLELAHRADAPVGVVGPAAAAARAAEPGVQRHQVHAGRARCWSACAGAATS